jgi:Yip1-like protein
VRGTPVPKDAKTFAQEWFAQYHIGASHPHPEQHRMTTPIRPDTDRGASYSPTSGGTGAPEKASVVEDFIDIFYAPSSVFARREKSGYGLQLLIITLLTALFVFASRGVFSQIFDAEFARGAAKAMAKNPQLTQEMMDRARPMQEKVTNFILYIMTPVIIFFTAFVVWLSAKILSVKITYGQAAMITTLAWIPRLVGGLLGAAQVLLMDTTNVTSPFALGFSPARFMNPDTTNGKLFGLVGSLDLFALWYAVLIGIGVAVVAKVPRARGYAVAGIVFALTTIPLFAFR